MPGLKSSILETIGNTPIVRINRLAPEGVELYAKIEAFNPLGSVKDRIALGIIEAAERDGSLRRGQTVVEATSGNTGIGLAMVCAQKGYPLVVTMAENFSVERRKLMRFLGAKVVLTPASEKGSGMQAKAEELAAANGWFLARQFQNEANPDIHSRTTAEEILADFAEGGLDFFVSGLGTGGTMKGVGRVLRVKSPSTKIIAVEPDNAPLLSSGIAQSYRLDGGIAQSHPSFRPHLMQGWTPDFIPKIANDVLEQKLVDEIRPVRGADALALTRELACKEGIFCGITGGATLAIALEVAREAPQGSRILAMLPDTGERYLTTPLFADVPEEMTLEEKEISASTPNYRFDVKAPATAAVLSEQPSSDAMCHVDDLISDPKEPVVMFALEWCEFCWSVRKLFAATGVRYRSIDLDSAEYRQNDWGGEVRKALASKTGAITIPQIFVGSEHIGGATDTFDAYNNGLLKDKLHRLDMDIDATAIKDAYSLLPSWLQPR